MPTLVEGIGYLTPIRVVADRQMAQFRAASTNSLIRPRFHRASAMVYHYAWGQDQRMKDKPNVFSRFLLATSDFRPCRSLASKNSRILFRIAFQKPFSSCTFLQLRTKLVQDQKLSTSYIAMTIPRLGRPWIRPNISPERAPKTSR